jgi:hypothetical protein
MVVCAHGDVADFCKKHEMVILESYDGDLKNYRGSCPVVVTAQKMTMVEYDSLKCEMFGRGVELVSVDWVDDEGILRLLRNQIERRSKRGGRQMFGYYRKNGVIVENPRMIAVARRIIALRDAGCTLRAIREDENVRHSDGKKLALSTIQQIVKNRDKYEKG